MEIEKDMFVRTKTGIKKIYEIDDKKSKWKYLYKLKKQDDDGCVNLGALCNDDIIGKPSFDIIDLVEVGDIVKTQKGKFEVINIDREYGIIACLGDVSFWHYEIESIATKEQFNAITYEVA